MVQQYFVPPGVISKLVDDIEELLNGFAIIYPYDESIVDIYTHDKELFSINRNLMVYDEDSNIIFPFTRLFLESIKPCYIQFYCKYSSSNKNSLEIDEMVTRGIPYYSNKNHKVLYGDLSLIPFID